MGNVAETEKVFKAIGVALNKFNVYVPVECDCVICNVRRGLIEIGKFICN